jgi:alkylation response protein AidB-like acyl-CoA dehydrogenase
VLGVVEEAGVIAVLTFAGRIALEHAYQRRTTDVADNRLIPGYPGRGTRLVGRVPADYFRRVDEQRGYPAEFVNALTKASRPAALIPQEYGGSGLGLTEASVIMEGRRVPSCR